jgi:hypothetical protein
MKKIALILLLSLFHSCLSQSGGGGSNNSSSSSSSSTDSDKSETTDTDTDSNIVNDSDSDPITDISDIDIESTFVPDDDALDRFQGLGNDDDDSEISFLLNRGLSHFYNNPSDQFIVDVNLISTGHPYLGKNVSSSVLSRPDGRTLQPHSGAHLYYKTALVPPYSVTPDVSSFPSVYAIANSQVDKVATWMGMSNNDYNEPLDSRCNDISGYDSCFKKIVATCKNTSGEMIGGEYQTCQNKQGENCVDSQTGQECFVPYKHYKYDIILVIAYEEGHSVRFGYSIESFGTPTHSGFVPASDWESLYKTNTGMKTPAQIKSHLDSDYYEQFIKVVEGEIIDIEEDKLIAHHFLDGELGRTDVPNQDAGSAHIHYNLWRTVARYPGLSFVSPSIFSQSVTDSVKGTWNHHLQWPVEPFNKCFGMYLDISENPFDDLYTQEEINAGNYNDCVSPLEQP